MAEGIYRPKECCDGVRQPAGASLSLWPERFTSNKEEEGAIVAAGKGDDLRRHQLTVVRGQSFSQSEFVEGLVPIEVGYVVLEDAENHSFFEGQYLDFVQIRGRHNRGS